MSLPPLPVPPRDPQSPDMQHWYYLLWQRVVAIAGTAWTAIDKVGSNLSDLETRKHTDLQDLNSSQYSHLTADQLQQLTGGGSTALHNHYNEAGQGTGSSGGGSSSSGVMISFEPGEDGEPGLPGPAGDRGSAGQAGSTVYIEPELPEEPLMIPGPTGPTGATGPAGSGSTPSNIIAAPLTISADTSYIVASYLAVQSDLTVAGNLMIVG